MTIVRQRANRLQPVTGFVLAGGKSRRMGHDKALLDWHGRTLLDHMAQLLSTVANPVRIVGREELPDAVQGLGPLGGILTAVRASETEYSIVAAVDLPLLTQEFLLNFRRRLEKSRRRILACRIGSHFPLCLGIRSSLLPDIELAIQSNEMSVHALIENSDPEIIVDAPPSIFSNVNTYEDYQDVLRRSNGISDNEGEQRGFAQKRNAGTK